MTYLEILQRQLPVDEGVRKKMYKCSEGYWTAGIGRNLEAKGFREDEIALMFKNDLDDAIADAKALVPAFDELSEARKAVVVNMSFQLGKSRLSGFKRFLAALNAHDYEQAAKEMADSLWASQTPERAGRLIQLMRNG